MEEISEITGVVVDREGRPLRGGGASVRVEADDFEASCECDERGRFAVPAPAGQTVWVWSEPEGFAPGSACVVAPAREVRIVVTPESILVGRVVDRASGEPIAGARVSVSRPASLAVAGDAEAISDQDGRFRVRSLAPGRCEPEVHAEDWRGNAGSVALGYRETSRELLIALSRCPSVRGRVLLPEPLKRRGFVRVVGRDGGRRTGNIEDDGSFEIHGVIPGRWHLNVDAAPFIEVAPRELAIEHDVEDLILAVRRGARLDGTVVDGDGNLIEGASLALYHGGWGHAPTEQVGSSFVYEGIRPGRYRLTASINGARGRASTALDVSVSEADVSDVKVVLSAERTAKLRGRIVDSEGRPIERGHATIIRVNNGEDHEGVSSDIHGSADGTFLFDDTSPGLYTVVPERLGLGEMKKPDGTSARIEVEIHEGDDFDIEIVVEESDQKIEGRAVDGSGVPFSGVLVAVAREHEDDDADEYAEALSVARNDESIAVLTDERGRFTIDALARGTYSVVAYRPEGEEMIARGVGTDQRVTLMLDPPGAITGQVDGEMEFDLCATREPIFPRSESFLTRDGSFRIDGLSAGKWRLQLVSATASAMIEVIVRAGRTTEVGAVRLEPFGTVRGRVVDGEGEPLARVEVVGLSTHPRNVYAETDEEGWYEMRIPKGWVHVDVPFGHHRAARGEVDAGEVIELGPIELSAS